MPGFAFKKLTWRCVGVCCILLVFGMVWVSSTGAKGAFLRVRVEKVLRDPRSGQPVVLLSDMQRARGMLIWIGEYEAQALRAAMMEVRYPRPLTHDLLMSVLQGLGAKLQELRITELEDDVFYAKLMLRRDHEVIEIDSRPSDGMVLAVRSKRPIMVSRSLFERQSMDLALSSLRRYGLGLQELTDELKEALGYHGKGVLVSQVDPDSQADRDGLRPKDIIQMARGTALTKVEQLQRALEAFKGKEIEVMVFRQGKELSMVLHP